MDKGCDIVLRGHHLRLLFDYCFLVGGEKHIRYNMLSTGYGEEHTNYTISIFKKITKITELDNVRIKILADSLDDICEKCCRIKHKFKLKLCNSDGDDLRTIADIGLRVDEVYTSKHILEKLKTLWEERNKKILEI